MQDQHIVQRDQGRNRCQVFAGVKGHLGIQRGIDGLNAAGGHEQGIAIRRRTRNFGTTNVAASAWLVVNSHGLAQVFGQLLCNGA